MPKQIKQTKQHISHLTYVEGNTVKKLAAAPVRQPRYDEEPLRKRTSRTVKRNRQKALSMNGPYVAFLAVAAVVCLLICTGYLMLQAQNMKVNDDITAMEKEIDTLTSQNDALNYSINSFIDVNNIIKVATEELGMIKTTKDNIEFYESTESEYINQYKDIPE